LNSSCSALKSANLRSCDRPPSFMPFSSRCCLWVPSLLSLLPFSLSLIYLVNCTTHEAPCQAVSSSPLLIPSCFVQILFSAICCNSLSDVSFDLFFLYVEVDEKLCLHLNIFIFVVTDGQAECKDLNRLTHSCTLVLPKCRNACTLLALSGT
jgi:hypothetical protein